MNQTNMHQTNMHQNNMHQNNMHQNNMNQNNMMDLMEKSRMSKHDNIDDINFVGLDMVNEHNKFEDSIRNGNNDMMAYSVDNNSNIGDYYDNSDDGMKGVSSITKFGHYNDNIIGMDDSGENDEVFAKIEEGGALFGSEIVDNYENEYYEDDDVYDCSDGQCYRRGNGMNENPITQNQYIENIIDSDVNNSGDRKEKYNNLAKKSESESNKMWIYVLLVIIVILILYIYTIN